MDAPALTIAVQDPAPEEATAWVAAKVAPLATAGLGWEKRVLGLFLRDPEGTVVSGARLEITGTDLHVVWLWTDRDCRGQGLGALLLAKAEHVAAREGCRRLYLNTMGFQAPRYYPRFGYEVIGVIPRFVHGYDRTYFRKEVAPGPVPPVPEGLTAELTDAPAKADMDRLDDGLTEHWQAAVGNSYGDVGTYARDDAGALVGGINAIRDARWWIILEGWVEPEHRGRGLGSRLLAALEEAARAAGAESVSAIPYEWQGPHFLMDRGYAQVTHIPDAVMGRPRWFVRKELAA
ncbi:MAG TPA: GNAT family N-acetyltransferase [Azospirillaceae bacterium]|nr:GNAT family N-acetyltransferase [Azospirillaceae bacterium]